MITLFSVLQYYKDLKRFRKQNPPSTPAMPLDERVIAGLSFDILFLALIVYAIIEL